MQICSLFTNKALSERIGRNTQVIVEQKLRKLLEEFQSGRRETSIFSLETIDSLPADKRRDWREIRKGLEEIGITLDAFNANKPFILGFLREALNNGDLEDSNVRSEASYSALESSQRSQHIDASHHQHRHDANVLLTFDPPVAIHLRGPLNNVHSSSSLVAGSSEKRDKPSSFTNKSLERKERLSDLTAEKPQLQHPSGLPNGVPDKQWPFSLRKVFQRSLGSSAKARHMSLVRSPSYSIPSTEPFDVFTNWRDRRESQDETPQDVGQSRTASLDTSTPISHNEKDIQYEACKIVLIGKLTKLKRGLMICSIQTSQLELLYTRKTSVGKLNGLDYNGQ